MCCDMILQRAALGETHEFASGNVSERELPASSDFILLRHNQDQSIIAKRKAIEAFGESRINGDADIGCARSECDGNLRAFALLHINTDGRIRRKEGRQRLRQMLHGS